MDTASLAKQQIDDILAAFDSVAAASGLVVPSIAALSARLTIELTGALKELSGNVFIAKRQPVERLDALTIEIKTAQLEMAKASAEAAAHTRGLVKWTRVQVFAAIAYTVITGGLLLVAILKG